MYLRAHAIFFCNTLLVKSLLKMHVFERHNFIQQIFHILIHSILYQSISESYWKD